MRKEKVLRTVDEEGFKEFLRTIGLKEGTIKGCVSHVKKFENYLLKYKKGKELEKTNPVDIKRFVLWVAGELRDAGAPLLGIQKYYEYKRREKMIEAIKKLKSELPRSKARKRMLITWDEFQERMEEVEKIGISDRNRALLNLHWSRMKPDEILQLRISDVDFEKYYIKSGISGSKFFVTEKAWNALEKYIPIEERDKRDRLFHARARARMSKRNLQHLVQKYFEELGQNPTTLRQSCERELIEAGQTSMFTVLEEKPKTEVGVLKKKIEELVFPTKVLQKLPPQVRKTVEGVITNYQNDFSDFCFWGMRKALIDAIRFRFQRDEKEEKLYDKDGNAYNLPKWIELAKQERYISRNSAKKLKAQVKVFGDVASHDYKVSLQREEVPSIFTQLRMALARMYYEED
jgi:integrase